MRFKTALTPFSLALIACFALMNARAMATSYTWTGTSGAVWSSTANWTSDHVPTTGGDEAVLGDVASGTNKVVVDASVAVFTLTINQVSAATNFLDVQNNFTISNAVTLGASNGGTSEIYVDVNASGTAGHGVTLGVLYGGITINSGGVLALSLGGTSGLLVPTINSNINLNGGLFVLYSNTQQLATNAGQAAINGTFAMTSGTLLVGGTMPGYTTGTSLWDPRMNFSSTFIVSGSGSVVSASTTTITLNGGTNSITGLSGSTSRIGTLTFFGSGTQTFVSDSTLSNWYIGYLNLRGGGGLTTKVLGSSIAGGTLGVGALGIGQGSNTGTTAAKLTSDLAATYATPIYASAGTSGTVYLNLDLNGHNFFATNGVVTFGTFSSTCWTYWNLQNSGATTGTVVGSGFVLTGSQVNIAPNIVLTATSSGVTNNLGYSSSGTISANSLFSYVGTGTAYLTSGRMIGGLSVGTGSSASVLTLSSNITTGTDISVTINNGATLATGTYNLALTPVTSTTISIGASATFDVSGRTSGYNLQSGVTIANTSGTVKGSLNLADGGTISMMTTGTGNQYASYITGNLVMTGGQVILYRAASYGMAGAYNIGGSFIMSGGTLNIGVTSGGSCADNRFYISGSTNITGGVINNVYVGGLFLNGAANSITGLSSTYTGQISLGGGNQTFVTDGTSISGTSSYTVRASSSGTSTKVIGTTTGGTLYIGTLAFGQQTGNGTVVMKLASNMVTTGTGGVGASFGVTGTNVNFGIDTNSLTLDLSSATAGFNPANVGSGSGTPVSWYLMNSGTAGSGTIAASSFNFSNASQVNVADNVILAMTGTAGGANLGSNGTIGANSVFTYIGTGTGTVTSGRALGRLAVGDGTNASTLAFVTAATETIQGDITVNKNAVLNLYDKTVTQIAGAGGTTGGLNGAGSIYNNGGGGATSVLTLNTTNGNGKFSGTIGDATGTGKGKVAVTVTGTGTQYFTGTNTYTGDTVISAGSLLALGDGTNDGVIANGSTIYNAGELDYYTSGTQNYGGVITGAGVVWMGGSGTQILSGNNLYSGPTFIDKGATLQIGAGGTTGSLSTQSDIYNDGMLAFNRADTITQGVHFANAISGSGGLTQAGSGTLVLGDNTYTGATIVAAGELDINGSLADASAVTVQAGATLGGNGTANGAVSVQSGNINGSGMHLGATKFDGQSALTGTTTAASYTVNSGTTSASGVHTTTGNLAVNAGSTMKNTGSFTANIVSVASTATLTNNGTLNGTVNVSGLLNGTGTINGALTIKTNGELAPGNSPGITTVAGNLTVETGAKISMQIDGITAAGTDYDQIIVTGATSLISLNAGSILSLSITDGAFTSGALTLIENQSDNAIVGTFSSVVIGGNTYDVSTTNKFTYGGKEYELLYNVNADGGTTANDFELTVVPEPGTWAMLVGGLGMLLGAQRMRRRSE